MQSELLCEIAGRPTAPVLIFGATGQIGRALTECDWSAWSDVVCVGRAEVDLLHRGRAASLIADVRPLLVINAAGYTSVDQAEREPDVVHRVNADAPTEMARACRSVGAVLIQISTDYVFDGLGRRPYREDDATAPLSVYGKSKLAGEAHVREELREHVILRTAWVYAPRGKNFVVTMLRLAAERERISVVNDQWGCPTSARSVAQAIAVIARAVERGSASWGTFHYVDEGSTTWHGLADATFELAQPFLGRRPTLESITTEQYSALATRPRYSILDCSRFSKCFELVGPHWHDELRWTLEQIAKDRTGR